MCQTLRRLAMKMSKQSPKKRAAGMRHFKFVLFKLCMNEFIKKNRSRIDFSEIIYVTVLTYSGAVCLLSVVTLLA